MKNDPPYIGVAVIVVRNKRVLLGKRKSSHGEGTWQFPGGHLEYGESIQACARREVWEETGLWIGEVRHAAFTNDIFEMENRHYVTLFVTASRVHGEPLVREPEKCETWQWFFWDDLPGPLFLPINNLLKQGFDIRQYF